MADPFMEARAMALLEFGCPPLPVANGTRLETGEPVIVNSHDLLGVFMLQAFKMQDSQINAARKKKQLEIASTYHRQLQSGQPLYQTMSEYTRDYLATYLLPPYSVNDVQILPPEHISPALLLEITRYHEALGGAPAGTATLDALLRGCAEKKES